MLLIIKSLVVGISLALIPGPIFFELTKRTLLKGWRSGLLLIAGDLVANTLIFFGTFSGSSLLLTYAQSSIFLQAWLLQIGGLLLLVLGVSGLFVKSEDLLHQTEEGYGDKKSFLIGAGMAFSSPLTIIALVGVGSATINEYGNGPLAFMQLLMIGLGIFCCYIAYIIFLDWHRKAIPSNILVYFAKAAGIALIGFGAWFLVQAMLLLG